MNLAILAKHNITPSIDVDTLRSVVALLRSFGAEISGQTETVASQVSDLRKHVESETASAACTGIAQDLIDSVWSFVNDNDGTDAALNLTVHLPNILDQLSKDLRSYRDFALEERVRSTRITSPDSSKSEAQEDYSNLRTFADSLMTMLTSMGQPIPSDLLKTRKVRGGGTTTVLDVPVVKSGGRTSKYSRLRFILNGSALADSVTPAELAHRYLSHGSVRVTTKEVVDDIGRVLPSFKPGAKGVLYFGFDVVEVFVPADADDSESDDDSDDADDDA